MGAAAGRQLRRWDLGEVAEFVCFNPNPELLIIAVAVGKRVLCLLPGAGVGSQAVREASIAACQPDAPPQPAHEPGTPLPCGTHPSLSPCCRA